MLKKIGLAVALVCAGALPAMAQAACTAPTAPAAVDGTTATKDQLLAGIKAAKAFIAASDAYQECLGDDLKAQKKRPRPNKKPLDPSIEKAATPRVATTRRRSKRSATKSMPPSAPTRSCIRN